MVIVASLLFVVALLLAVAATLVWRGSVQPFPASVRCNHAGVLGSAGAFTFVSGSLVLTAGIDVGLPLQLLAGGTWLLTFVAFLWMFLQTPNQWASRMARAAEHQFDSRFSQGDRPGDRAA